MSLPCQVQESLLPEERLSAPSALDNNGPCHNVIHSPVVLEEEESDEDGKEEGNGEVLIKCPHCRAVKVKTKETKQQVRLRIPTDALQVPETRLLLPPNEKVTYPVCAHSRREGNIRCWDYKDSVGSDQSGCVTCHHPQAKQELPWRGTASTPNTDYLI